MEATSGSWICWYLKDGPTILHEGFSDVPVSWTIADFFTQPKGLAVDVKSGIDLADYELVRVQGIHAR